MKKKLGRKVLLQGIKPATYHSAVHTTKPRNVHRQECQQQAINIRHVPFGSPQSFPTSVRFHHQ